MSYYELPENIKDYIDDLEDQIWDAIDILDGNKEPIDWRDKRHPELLRKLCEHLESLDKTNLYDKYILNRGAVSSSAESVS